MWPWAGGSGAGTKCGGLSFALSRIVGIREGFGGEVPFADVDRMAFSLVVVIDVVAGVREKVHEKENDRLVVSPLERAQTGNRIVEVASGIPS